MFCGRELDDGSSGVRRMFDLGGVMRPERKDWEDCVVGREGVWLRELVFEFPASAEAASPRQGAERGKGLLTT
jgi:hypothetical protein